MKHLSFLVGLVKDKENYLEKLEGNVQEIAPKVEKALNQLNGLGKERIWVSLFGYGDYRSYLNLNHLGEGRRSNLHPGLCVFEKREIEGVNVFGGEQYLFSPPENKRLRLTVDGESKAVVSFLKKLFRFLSPKAHLR